MAEYIVSLVVEKIANLLVEEAVSLSKVHDQIEWIEAELRRMQCFLKDADAKQDRDERIRNWVVDIRDVAYDTDDVIDAFILRMTYKRYPFILNELIARRKLNNHIGKIKIKINDITDSRSTYGIENIVRLGPGGTNFAVGHLQEKRRSYAYACDDDIVGLAEDIKMLEARVIHGEPRRCVISIVGMAGLGKTTLAKRIYQSSDVKKHFDCCAWVYVSQEYKAKEILQDLAKKVIGVAKMGLEKMNNEDLKEMLSKFMEERRYIVVLDDIWKKEVWDDLKVALPDTKNGSRILFTTRFKDVALYADLRTPPHELSLLSEEDSLELLLKKVCIELNPTASLPPWSAELGRDIVKKCGGLPLAIVVVGGLLSRKEVTYSEWHKVLQSVHWQLTQDPSQCVDILALSYHDLPYYLKSCFLYFGLFPEDFEISVRRLILLWVAEGFVQPRDQEPLEDVAEDYLEELMGRSMIQVATRKSNGRIKSCRIHDLLREFSISKAKEDRFLEVIHPDIKVRSLTSGHRLAIYFRVPPTTKNTRNVRSLLFFDLSKPIISEVKKFNLLRVLDLEGVCIAKLDQAIGKLIHLRYLGLRGTWLKKLPSTIGHLLNLQTLDLRSTLINPVAVVIFNFQKLRHLYFNDMVEMMLSPTTSTFLPDLQTLHGICINGTSCVESGLNRLTNLTELAVYGYLLLQEEAIGEWIFNTKGLQCLKLHASRPDYSTAAGIPKLMSFSAHIHLYKLHLGGFLKELPAIEDFPPNLTELSLSGSFLMEDPLEKLERLPNLRILKLKRSSYVGKEMLCSSEGFPQLHFLKLSFLYSVQTLRIEEGAMGNLRQLEIVDCQSLNFVPRGLWPVTTLRSLKLGFMPHDFEIKVGDRMGENWYRIEHILPM